MKGSFSESHDDWLPQLYQEEWDAFVRLATLLLADQRVAEAAVIAAFVTSYRRDPRLHSQGPTTGRTRHNSSPSPRRVGVLVSAGAAGPTA